ncbi:transporter substrate-binding domain-containing protein [Mycobacterium tilburgii]|uniref:transporter substrate-binding domain-containing protein n=1 Tax=Mycobacterium tilburgii TaxID=44467 RepID=UPI0038991897
MLVGHNGGLRGNFVVAVNDRSRTAVPDSPAARVLLVCTTGDYAPMIFRAPDYIGMDIEMAYAFASHLNRVASFVSTTWKSLMADINTPG